MPRLNNRMRQRHKLYVTSSLKRLAWLLGLVLLVSACHRNSPWATKDVSGLMPSLAFDLTESEREAPVHATDYRGWIKLLYFGYTHCPDVCPMTLQRLQNAVAELGEQAKQVRILFVTVDPQRDSVHELGQYVRYFGPQVVGLWGSQAAVRALTKSYRVSYGYGKPDAKGNYTVSHSSAVYVFDRDGEVRLLVRPTDTVPAITHDLKRLLAEK